MKDTSTDGIINALNEALLAERKAVKMYHVHAVAIADPEIVRGLRTIQEIEEGHARALTRRIAALGGHPVAAGSTEIRSEAGATRDPQLIADMLRLDLADEQWAIRHYAATIADYILVSDGETLTVLQENLIDELRHAHWLRDRLRSLIGSE